MRSFNDILALAAARKGSITAVLDGVILPRPDAELAAIPDDRWLAAMARGIFQAGISWAVVDAKWPGIEVALHSFMPARLSLLSEDDIEALLSDRRVIRSGPKLLAIRENAAFVTRTVAESGSFGQRIAAWPSRDYIGLLAWLGREGSRLGGTTGQYMLRHMGKESFLLTDDVVARLQAEGVIDGPATSARALRAVQAAFDQWQQESGRSFNEISRVLAQSIG